MLTLNKTKLHPHPEWLKNILASFHFSDISQSRGEKIKVDKGRVRDSKAKWFLPRIHNFLYLLN